MMKHRLFTRLKLREQRHVDARLHWAAARLRDREREVMLEVSLGVRAPRCGYWAWVYNVGSPTPRTKRAHFFIEPRVRIASACRRWDVPQSEAYGVMLRRVNILDYQYVCMKCAWVLEQENM